MTERDAPGITPQPKPFVDDLLDFITNVRPIILKTVLVVDFGALLALAPEITRWVVVILVMMVVPGALDLRGQLACAEAQLREAAVFKRGACAALRIAMDRVDALEAELRRRPGGATGDPLYRRVGLDVDAPD